MSWPIWQSSSMRKMPSSMAYGKSPLVRPSSPSEQSMPLDMTPLSLPLVILTPFGSSDLCRATGTMSPAWTLEAPVTICTGSSWPTSSWQITRWSESGCFSTDRILPTTTFLTSSNSVFQPSTFEPDILSCFGEIPHRDFPNIDIIFQPSHRKIHSSSFLSWIDLFSGDRQALPRRSARRLFKKGLRKLSIFLF